MVIAGWPCQGHSCVGARRGLEDPRSSLFWDLIRLMQWWIAHQHSPPKYIFESVPLLGDSRDKVLEGQHYVYQHHGDPIFMDAASLGSYAHRPRWIWTNLASLSTLAATFSAVPPPFDQKVDHILDSNWTSLSVVRDNLPPLALVNKVGAPRRVFSHLYDVPTVIRIRWPDMVWDADTKIPPSHWLTNGSVPWDTPLAPSQLLVIPKATDASCLAKPWTFIPWCELLIYILHCNNIMVIICCLWRQRTMVKRHIGLHPWRRELGLWFEKSNKSLDLNNK